MKYIKKIGNPYGGLVIQELNNKYYWIIENYNTDLSNIEEWVEIPKELYLLLLDQ